MAKKKLGIIQSRGLGDILIALPIARDYHEQGWEVLWPIEQQFLAHVEHHVPWVKWIPVPHDAPGRYFYDVPMERLKNFKCDEILPLYQALTNHNFHEEAYFQYTKFDQYKYIKAGVNFLKKWDLRACITRDLIAEQSLYDRVVTNPRYAVLHLEGSDHQARFDRSMIPEEWQTIEITARETPSIFNWLTVLEGAESIVCVDSCFANLVDQMSIGDDLYLIARSHIGLTPVYAQPWTWLPKT
jgi:hypothetical protein